MLEHPQTIARDMVVETSHECLGRVKGLGMAVKFHGTETIESKPPPTHGQDSRLVLSELGYSDSQIEALYTHGVIHTS
jgi:formyl-CoA transferase